MKIDKAGLIELVDIAIMRGIDAAIVLAEPVYRREARRRMTREAQAEIEQMTGDPEEVDLW